MDIKVQRCVSKCLPTRVLYTFETDAAPLQRTRPDLAIVKELEHTEILFSYLNGRFVMFCLTKDVLAFLVGKQKMCMAYVWAVCRLSLLQYDPKLKLALIKLYSLDRVSAVSPKQPYTFRLQKQKWFLWKLFVLFSQHFISVFSPNPLLNLIKTIFI